MANTTKIRIKDIAQMAGVSAGTVDRVLHKRPNVSPESKKKVEKILEEIDYMPNRNASALARNKPLVIVAFIPQHNSGNYWEDIVLGMEQGKEQYTDFGAELKIMTYDPYNFYTFTQRAQEILDTQPNGVIIAPTHAEYNKILIDQLSEANIPFVYIDSEYKEKAPLSFFGQNPTESGHFAAHMMMLLNPNNKPLLIFRKIAEGVLGSNQQFYRQTGFEEYMKNHHPEVAIHILDLHAMKPQEDEQMLDAFFDTHPEAEAGILFNSIAYIVAGYLKKKNKDHFHLIGYDLLKENVRYLKEGAIDFLIAQNPQEQGYRCVKALADYVLFRTEVDQTNYVPIHLVSAETIDSYLNYK